MNSNVNVAFTNSDGTAVDSIQVLKNDLMFTGVIERDFFYNPSLNKYLLGNGRMGDYLGLDDWGEINQDNPDTKSTYIIGTDELGEGVEDIRDNFLQEKPSEVVVV